MQTQPMTCPHIRYQIRAEQAKTETTTNIEICAIITDCYSLTGIRNGKDDDKTSHTHTHTQRLGYFLVGVMKLTTNSCIDSTSVRLSFMSQSVQLWGAIEMQVSKTQLDLVNNTQWPVEHLLQSNNKFSPLVSSEKRIACGASLHQSAERRT